MLITMLIMSTTVEKTRYFKEKNAVINICYLITFMLIEEKTQIFKQFVIFVLSTALRK